jgi:hypothetical protein
MYVGMIVHLPPPGVQDTEKARQIPTDVFGIGGQHLQGIRRSFKKGGIADFLMTANKASELPRYGEGDHKMVSGQLID